MRASMSATGSVNLIVCFSSSCPFAPRLRRTCGSSKSSVVGRSSLVVGQQRTTGGQRLLYQDDFETPGISPRSANPRKHRRQIPNLRMYARGRPQILQRLCLRVENFGFFASLTRFAVVAKLGS